MKLLKQCTDIDPHINQHNNVSSCLPILDRWKILYRIFFNYLTWLAWKVFGRNSSDRVTWNFQFLSNRVNWISRVLIHDFVRLSDWIRKISRDFTAVEFSTVSSSSLQILTIIDRTNFRKHDNLPLRLRLQCAFSFSDILMLVVIYPKGNDNHNKFEK